jgi:DNA-directed RNA polymerase specialized sigma24 family protein
MIYDDPRSIVLSMEPRVRDLSQPLVRYQRIRDRRPGRLAEEPRDEREADSEAALQMRLAAQALPARLGIVYELYYCRGLRIGEVASFLERPPGTVKYQLHEIRSFLRRRLT